MFFSAGTVRLVQSSLVTVGTRGIEPVPSRWHLVNAETIYRLGLNIRFTDSIAPGWYAG